MRPQNALDWAAFVFLLIGAFAWGAFVTDVNVLDVALEAIWDPLDGAPDAKEGGVSSVGCYRCPMSYVR